MKFNKVLKLKFKYAYHVKKTYAEQFLVLTYFQ